MASGNDMKAHESTYSGFTSVVKWGTVAAVLVTAFILYMITK
ncbi:MAG: aa3-type cytochrome c oxidase subunit IV [Novosphingobium sp.]